MKPFLWTPSSLLVSALAILFFTSCSAPPKPGTTVMAPTPVGVVEGVSQPVDRLRDENLSSDVPVFIVSGRALGEKMQRGVDPFANERSETRDPRLAVAEVSVGEGLTSDEIYEETTTEVKKKKTRFRLREVSLAPALENIDPWQLRGDGRRHATHPWIREIRAQLDRGKTRQIVIFVHGYNTHLITNTEQAADLYHYLGRDGAVINFEWPSVGSLTGYVKDKGNARQSTRLFRNMISNLAEATDASRIMILAHSAGNPIVVNAMSELRLIENQLSREQLYQKYKLDRVVLAAPDMDLMEFFNAVFDRFYECARGVAVYSSPDDKALKLSSILYGDTRLGRSIGELQPWELEVLDRADGIEMIDVTVPESMFGGGLGHSYFHRDPWVSSDIGLFLSETSPERRALVKQEDSVFWGFPKDYREKLRAMKRH